MLKNLMEIILAGFVLLGCSTPDLLYSSITSDKEIYQLGEPIIITCLLVNQGNRKIKIEDPCLICCVIKYDKGSYSYGDDLPPYDLPKIVLQPGEQWKKSGEIELRGPGAYEIRVCGIRDKRIICPKTIAVKVVPPTDEVVYQKKISRLLDKLDKTYLDRSLYNSSTDDKIVCWSQAQLDLAEMGELSVPTLRHTLNSHPNPVVRGKIAVVLGRFKSKESLPELHQALKDPVPAVRKAVIDALRVIKEDSSEKELITMLKDEDAQVRWRTISALEIYPPSEDVKQVFVNIMLTDKDSWVRVRAAQALANHYKFTKAVPVLIEFLKTTKNDSACLTIKALEGITGLNLGPAPFSGCLSDTGDIEKAQKELEQTSNKWLLWWEEEGKKKYSE